MCLNVSVSIVFEELELHAIVSWKCSLIFSANLNVGK